MNVFSILWFSPQVAGDSNLGDALVQANAKGFPAGLLYSVAGLEGRSGNDKELLAAALESPKVQQDARKAAIEYAVKDLPTGRENTEGYCSYSWLRWLPFMDCETTVNEVRQAIQLINNNKRNCIRWTSIELTIWQGHNIIKIKTYSTTNVLALMFNYLKNKNIYLFIYTKKW